MIDYLLLFVICAALGTMAWVLLRRVSGRPWITSQQQSILDSFEDALLVYAHDGQLEFLNRTARVWFGFDEEENVDARAVQAQIAPVDELLALLSRGGRASLEIGSRYVAAVSQQIDGLETGHIALILRDVTASQAFLIEERRRQGTLAVLSEVDRRVGASSVADEMLDGILDKLEELSPFTSAVISLWNPKTEQMVARRSVGSVPVSTVRSLDDGFLSRIVRDRASMLLEDAAQHPRPLVDPSIQSYVGLPLWARQKLIGVLELFSDQSSAFSPETRDMLQIIASHVAVAFENARLRSETALRADEMATMNSLSAAINTSLNLDELLEIIVYAVNQAIECDRSAVFLMDNERGILSLVKSRGLSEDFVRRNQSIRPELGGQGQVILDRYPLVVNDIQQVQTLPQLVSLMSREGISAFVDLPLRGREHVLGALTVYYNHPHTFDESELELLRAIANQVTLALENARLYERTDRALARRVDQLAAIEEIGRELTSTLDMTRVFNLVLQRAMGTTGASAGFLALCDDQGEELELIVDRGYSKGTLDRYRQSGWPTTYGIVGRVARTGETALVNDVHTDPSYVSFLTDTCAKLVVPIVKEARVLGVVSLESSRPNGFSPDDVRFTTQLAELAAIAIDNARLFQQVREGRDNLQAILDSTHEGILVIGRDERIVLANPMIEEMSGISAEALVGQPVKQLIAELGAQALVLLGYSAGELEKALDLLDATSDQVTKRTYEVPDSPTLHIEQVALPVIDKDDAVVGRLVVFRDVTEEHRLQVMRQNLSDMIIHDLRSPLTAVIGGVQVASDLTAVSADPEAIQHALAMADQSCDRLMSLVDSLLDISRLEAGQMPLELQPVLLSKLAESVIQQMRPLAERGGVTLFLEVEPETPPVDADSELIQRVLVNLLDNALKHSPRNSMVTIQIASESMEMEMAAANRPTRSSNPVIRCTVLDSGPGIPVEHRKRVFERFAQLDDRRRGKGLGLAFCQLAIQQHSGRIWVEDNPRGKGSAFIFTVPVANAVFSAPMSDRAG